MERRIRYAKTADGVSDAFWTLGKGCPLCRHRSCLVMSSWSGELFGKDVDDRVFNPVSVPLQDRRAER
jgi:hypothetical protein